ncbi:MAG: FlgD immunoglobulin-like domain containing protein [Bacteroidota bacterium]
MRTPRLLLFLLLVGGAAVAAHGQNIWPPEGLNMPGSWDTAGGKWVNPPSLPVFAGIIRPYGLFLLDTSLASRRYRTVVNVQASGGDLAGGTYKWLFTSPFHWTQPDSTAWGNKWKTGTVTIGSVQNYAYWGVGQSPPDSNIVTLVDGNWYTVNWWDKPPGYVATSAIWMRTSGPPVTIPAVAQSPLPGSVQDFDTVTVTATLGGTPPAEQNFFVRYSIDNFASAAVLPMTVAGSTATGKIPPQTGGTSVKYYVFSSTSTFPTADFDIRTLTHNNNNKLNYAYSVIASQYFITVSFGPNGTVTPPGPTVIVLPGGDTTFTFTPNPTYYVDSVVVDNVLVDSTTSYTFTNVNSNHTLRVSFVQKVNVTYQVHMGRKMLQGVFLPDSGDIVAIRGSFNNWGDPPTGIRDTLQGAGDSIWTITKLLKASSTQKHKFWKTERPTGGQGYETSIGDRVVNIGANDTTIAVVYFDNDSPPTTVTFRVNMKVKMLERAFRPDLGDSVTVRGSFNNWANPPDSNSLVLTGPGPDSVYTGTFTVPSNVLIEYKFWKSLRPWDGYEPTIVNRTYLTPYTPSTLPVVYYDNDSVVSVWVGTISGWNMISKPVETSADSVRQLFPAAANAYAFAFNQTAGYQQSFIMQGGVGYWEKFSADSSYDIAGAYILTDTIPVAAGWNMIGGISVPVDTGTIIEDPTGVVTSVYFGYNGGYVEATSLQPGKAYWAKASGPGRIFVSNTALAAGQAPARMGRSPLEGFNTITIADARGARQTLYFGEAASGVRTDRYEMPPPAPEGSFDARFETQRMAEVLGAEGGVLGIALRADAYPLTVSWQIGRSAGREIVLRDPATGAGRTLSGSGALLLKGSSGRLVLEVGGSVLPEEFALLQNYPNPFNPATSIRYALPVDAKVAVEIFDVLGRRVAALVNDIQPAGYRTVEWNGRNAAGVQVASGVYFYRLEVTPLDGAQGFLSTKKMMMLK